MPVSGDCHGRPGRAFFQRLIKRESLLHRPASKPGISEARNLSLRHTVRPCCPAVSRARLATTKGYYTIYDAGKYVCKPAPAPQANAPPSRGLHEMSPTQDPLRRGNSLLRGLHAERRPLRLRRRPPIHTSPAHAWLEHVSGFNANHSHLLPIADPLALCTQLFG